MRASVGRVAALAGAAWLLSACSGGGDIEVADAWARSPMQDVGAVYFTVTNGGDAEDALVAVRVDVAGRAEIHETVMEGGQGTMQPVDAVAVPAGGEVAFEPGGYHVMLFDLEAPLVVGEAISVVLEFREAGDVEVEARIEEFVQPGTGEGMDMGDGEM